MIRTAIVILPFLFSNIWGQTQVFWQNPWPQGNDLRSVHAINDTVIIAVGDLGTVIRTVNGGFTWEIMKLSEKPLYDVEFIGQFGWAVGGNELFRSFDQGENWERIPNSPYYLQAISFVDSMNGWAHNSYEIYRTIDGGLTWKKEKRLFPINSLSVVDNERILAVGKEMLFTVDGGRKWQKLKSIPREFKSTYFVNSEIGHAVDKYGIFFLTRDGGETWSQKPCPLSNGASLWGIEGVKCFAFTKNGRGFAINQNGTLCITRDLGEKWAMVSEGRYTALSFASDEIGWVVGENGAIMKTIDGGDTWIHIARGQMPNKLHSVNFANSKVGWAVGQNGVILNTKDGGESWNLQENILPNNRVEGSELDSVFQIDVRSLKTKYLRSVFFSDSARGWAVGDDGVVLTTVNGGDTWALDSFDKAQNRSDIAFVTPNTGWIISNIGNFPSYKGRVFSTKNGGINWLNQFTTDKLLTALYFVDENNGWIGGQYGFVWSTRDGGNTWELKPLQPGLLLVENIFVDSWETVWVLATRTARDWDKMGKSVLFKIGKEDPTPIMIKLPILGASRQIFDIWAFDNGELLAVGGDDELWGAGYTGYIFSSVDEGENWTTVKELDGPLRSCFFLDELTGWAVGSNGTILKIQKSRRSIDRLSLKTNPVSNSPTNQVAVIKVKNKSFEHGQVETRGYRITEAGNIKVNVSSIDGEPNNGNREFKVPPGQHTLQVTFSGSTTFTTTGKKVFYSSIEPCTITFFAFAGQHYTVTGTDYPSLNIIIKDDYTTLAEIGCKANFVREPN